MMKKIYAYSNKVGGDSVVTCNNLYLLLRTVCVAVISAAIAMLLNLFVSIPGMTHQTFLLFVCGWATVGYGFFGGILVLMRK